MFPENNLPPSPNNTWGEKSKSQTVNYISLINSVWQEMPFLDGYKGTHAAVFFAIVDSINRNRWHSVALPLDYIINKIGFCRKAYTDSRIWLEKNGMLSIIPGKNANQMAIFSLGPAVHIWTGRYTGTDTSTDTSTSKTPVQKRTARRTHYKTGNKEDKPKTLSEEFEKWWNAYDKKVGLTKAVIAWEHLSEEERRLAYSHTLSYVQSTSEARWRKDPCKYLEEKAYHDVIIPLSSSSKNHSSILQPITYGNRARF
ncbi:hypothetical protein SAMN05444008_11290 [Cnuella takakiae]|uniref:Helix-turn-helix domain-containing protein n=1 Tax=Cnuella takakiae TaxID=1302690 RepID=A0A1M5ELM9_9BACT|nr:hypothetical protein [Cnuella takakiae]SHF79932.1 hypothetical protein SAMN05444008_11290 [Cnuella takakiae]